MKKELVGLVLATIISASANAEPMSPVVPLVDPGTIAAHDEGTIDLSPIQSTAPSALFQVICNFLASQTGAAATFTTTSVETGAFFQYVKNGNIVQRSSGAVPNMCANGAGCTFKAKKVIRGGASPNTISIANLDDTATLTVTNCSAKPMDVGQVTKKA